MQALSIPTGPTRRCPRCFKLYPTIWFQEPVAICMLCYESIPANKGLKLEQLKEKAKQSKWARHYHNKSRIEEKIARFTNSPSADREQRDLDSSYISDECSICEKVFPIDELENVTGNKVRPDVGIACNSCAVLLRLEGEKS